MTAIRDGFGLPQVGGDLDLYRHATTRWMEGGPFYEPFQLAGSYGLWDRPTMPILYPPTTIPLFAIFTVLPTFLWWAIPAAIVLGVLKHLRTRPTALLICGLLVIWPTTSISVIWVGNPAMWACAALALATARPWAGPLVLLKPSLAPFAFFGIRNRSWWIGMAAWAAVAVAFLPLWGAYVIAVMNTGESIFYSTWNIPLMLVPVMGWLGRERTPGTEAPRPFNPRQPSWLRWSVNL